MAGYGEGGYGQVPYGGDLENVDPGAFTLGLPSTTSSALPLVPPQEFTLGLPSVTSTALSIAVEYDVSFALGIPVVTATALPANIYEVGAPVSFTLGLPEATSTALGIQVEQDLVFTLGLPSVTHTALPIAAMAQSPAGDKRDFPIEIGELSASETIDLDDYTTEVGESLPTGVTKTAWLTWTAPEGTGAGARFRIANTSASIQIFDEDGDLVYAQNNGAAIDYKLAATPGAVYEIQVGVGAGDPTVVVLSWSPADPQPYDDISKALEINGTYGADTITLVNGTAPGGEGAPVGSVATSWATFTAEETTGLSFSVVGSDPSAAFTVKAFTSGFTEVASAPATGGQARLGFDVVQGTQYWVQFSSPTTDALSFDFNYAVSPVIVAPALPVDMVIAEVYAPDGVTKITEIPRRTGLQFQEALNEVGAGEVTVRVDDEILNAYPGLFQWRNIIKFWIGEVCVHGFRIQKRRTSLVTSGEYAGWVRTISGPSVHHLLEDFIVKHEMSPLQDRFLESRMFGWMSPPNDYWYDPAEWNGVYNTNWQNDPPSDFGKPLKEKAKYKQPKRWPDPSSRWVWMSADPDKNEWGYAPEDMGARRYFRKTFTITKPVVTARAFGTADEDFKVWLDGELILEGSGDETGFESFEKNRLKIKKGTHTIAIWMRNLGGNTEISDGADAVMFTLMKLNNKGVEKDVIIHTDGTWETTYLRPPPGWNRAGVLLKILEEAQLRGNTSALMLTPTFDHLVDSYGVAWDDRFQEEIPIGTTAYQLQQILSEGNDFDVWVNPETLELNAYRRRGIDMSYSVALEPGRNLLNWEVEETENVKNTYLIHYDGGWTEEQVDSSILNYGNREAFVSMGRAKDDNAARRTVRKASRGLAWAEQRAGTTDLRRRREAEPSGSMIAVDGARPFLDFNIGDTINAPDRTGLLIPHRTIMLTAVEANEFLTYDPELEEIPLA